jgi:hypothetical protein
VPDSCVRGADLYGAVIRRSAIKAIPPRLQDVLVPLRASRGRHASGREVGTACSPSGASTPPAASWPTSGWPRSGQGSRARPHRRGPAGLEA